MKNTNIKKASAKRIQDAVYVFFLKNAGVHALVAFCLSFGWWYSYQKSSYIERSYAIPCSFYDIPLERVIEAPDMIYVRLKGTKKDLAFLEHAHPALHINGKMLKPGKNKLEVTSHSLFLPLSVKLLEWSPVNSYIIVQ